VTSAPAVEVTYHRDLFGVRGPHCETDRRICVISYRMRAQLRAEAAVSALVEEVQILVAQQTRPERLCGNS